MQLHHNFDLYVLFTQVHICFINDNHGKMKYTAFVAQEMMQNGHISVEVIDAKSQWFGVTYYEDKEVAVNTLAQLTEAKKYPSPLWS